MIRFREAFASNLLFFHLLSLAASAIFPEIASAIGIRELKGTGEGLKFGDKCRETAECDFEGSICDSILKLCQCIPELPVTNHLDKCGKAASVNESCTFNEQCEQTVFLTECRDGRCFCRFDKIPVANEDGTIGCQSIPQEPKESPHRVDPTMIGILAGMVLMFIILCVVLRLFSKARWRENRTIFNTPNPRLMNASLLQHNKSFHDGRRGSRMSNRGLSRAGSLNSMRPDSPSASLGGAKSRRGSRDDSLPDVKSPSRKFRERSPETETAKDEFLASGERREIA